MHNFKRVMGMRMVDHTCLFSGGTSGEVCSLKVLPTQDHPLPRNAIMVALGMLSKVLVAYIHPEVKVEMQIARQDADGALIPSMAWLATIAASSRRPALTSPLSPLPLPFFPCIHLHHRNFVPLRSKSGNLRYEPVLAFSWGNNVRFMQVTPAKDEPNSRSKVSKRGTFHARAPVVCLRWLGDHTLMTMDTQERVHVIDVQAMALVDVVDLSRAQMVFNTKFAQTMARLHRNVSANLRDYDSSLSAVGSGKEEARWVVPSLHDTNVILTSVL